MLRELMRRIFVAAPHAERLSQRPHGAAIAELRRRKVRLGEEAGARADGLGTGNAPSRRTPAFPIVQLLLLTMLIVPCALRGRVHAQALPTVIPAGTALVVADQNEELQTLMIASGEQDKLAGKVTYANFLGGPSILEAFRARALDLAQVGDAPPIQAQAAGETLAIVAARVSLAARLQIRHPARSQRFKSGRLPRQAHFLWRRHRPATFSAGGAQAGRLDP
jgi:hypothetical protein